MKFNERFSDGFSWCICATTIHVTGVPGYEPSITKDKNLAKHPNNHG